MFWSKKSDPIKHELANARQVLEGAISANAKANERVSAAAAEVSRSGDAFRAMVEEATRRLGARHA